MSLAAIVAEAAAVAFVATRGNLFKPLRVRGPAWWRELSTCQLCAGTWAGIVFALASGWASGPLAARGLAALGAGCLAGVLAMFLRLCADAAEAFAASHEAQAKAQGAQADAAVGMTAALQEQAQAMVASAEADQQRNVIYERSMPPRPMARVQPLKPVK